MKLCKLMLFVHLLVSCDTHEVKLTPKQFECWLYQEKMAIDEIIDSCRVNLENVNLENEESFIYITNVTCSACIYSFVEFAKYNEKLCNEPLIVIIEEGYKPQLHYAMEQSEIKKENITIIENTNHSIIDGNIDNLDLNGQVFYWKNSKVLRNFVFLGKTIYEEAI